MKNFIKLLLAIVTLVLLNVSSASAFSILNDWKLDATAYGGGVSGPINGILFQSPGDGTTNVVQNLGGNGQIDNGDTFTETLWMTANDYNKQGATGTFGLDLGAGNNLIIAVAATGKVVDYVSDLDYGYTLSGTVNFYIDDDQDWAPFSGVAEIGVAPQLIASSTIVETGTAAGTADGFLGSSFEDAFSNWAVTMEFDWMAADVFLNAADEDLFTTYPGVMGDAQGVTRLTSAAVTGQDTVTFSGKTGDDLKIAVVPEPATFMLLGISLLGLAGISRKRKL